MKKYIILILFLSAVPSFSQVEIRAGMGIDFTSSPSFTDYLNQNYASSFDQIGSFFSSVIFSGEVGYYLSNDFQLSADVGYIINSFTFSNELGKYEFSYNIISPSVMGYYVLSGQGYNFKFGGGVGPRFLNAEETLRGTVSPIEYSSTGFGIILRADGNTILGGNLYANIGADIKYNFIGELKSGEDYLVNNADHENVNFNSFSAGVKLGITLLF